MLAPQLHEDILDQVFGRIPVGNDPVYRQAQETVVFPEQLIDNFGWVIPQLLRPICRIG